MATADSVKNKIQGLINTANATTGKADTDLTSAVGALIAGFGQGGGGGGSSGGGASGIYMAKITPAEYSASDITITHNLGTTDILYVALWAETLGDIVPETNVTLCKFWAKTDINTRRGGNGFSNGYAWVASSNYADPNSPNTAAYETLNVIDENTIKLPRTQSGTGTGICVGVTYTVFVIPVSAFSVTEG